MKITDCRATVSNIKVFITQAKRMIKTVTSQDTCLFRIDDAFAIEVDVRLVRMMQAKPYGFNCPAACMCTFLSFIPAAEYPESMKDFLQ